VQQDSANEAKEACPKLPKIHQYPASWSDEPDPLVYSVKIILRRDVIFVAVLVMMKLDDRGQVDRSVVERNQPDAEDLEDRHIEGEI